MKIVKCENGNHYYDAELHASCPQCGNTQDVGKTAGIIGSNAQIPTPAGNAAGVVYCTNCGKSMSVVKQFCSNCGTKLKKSTAETQSPAADAGINNSATTADVLVKPAVETTFPVTQPIITHPYAGETDKAEKSDGLSDVEADGDRDVEPQSSVEEEVTNDVERDMISGQSRDDGEAEVAGWLVCVSGTYRGRSFEIISGQNYIGRAFDMSISLDREKSVSFLRHAAIIYEPQKSVFYVQQGESRGLTYHNGELVFAHSELKAYDKIRLGNAEFVFVPLCGENFTWDDHVEEMKD